MLPHHAIVLHTVGAHKGLMPTHVAWVYARQFANRRIRLKAILCCHIMRYGCIEQVREVGRDLHIEVYGWHGSDTGVHLVVTNERLAT